MKDLETKVEKMDLSHGLKILVVTSSELGGEAKKWYRFNWDGMRDWNYTSTNTWDAVAYKPKRNVVFRGFGIFANSNNKDFNCFLKWEVDGKESDEYEVHFVNSERCEHKMFEFHLKDVGARAFKVSEGTLIHVGIKFPQEDSDYRRSVSGYNGEQSYYRAIDYQEYDFDTENSHINQGFTGKTYGLMPYIIYS